MFKGNIKKTIGLIVILLAITTPLILWLFFSNIQDKFDSLKQILTSLGQITALLGMIMFSITLVLSARVKFLEPYLGGQSKAYVNHHYLGATAFIFLLMHPLFLGLKFFLISPKDAFEFFMPWLQSNAVLYGSIALFFMITALFFTFYKKLPYEWWRKTHRFLGLAFFFGGIHAFLIGSDISKILPLKIYMAVFIFLGITALLYRVVLKKILVKTYRYEIDVVNRINNNIYEINLIPKGEKIKYKAGQYAFVGFTSSFLPKEVHPYSFASTESAEKLSFVIKTLGDYTIKVGNLNKGDIALIEGSFGIFTLDSSKTENQIWIAGGIGITPFLSMARSLEREEYQNYSADLYYSTKTREELVYLDELKEIQSRTGRLRVFEVVSNDKGNITAKDVYKYSNKNADIFICGPKVMMDSLRDQFVSIGATHSRIHTEEFSIQN